MKNFQLRARGGDGVDHDHHHHHRCRRCRCRCRRRRRRRRCTLGKECNQSFESIIWSPPPSTEIFFAGNLTFRNLDRIFVRKQYTVPYGYGVDPMVIFWVKFYSTLEID